MQPAIEELTETCSVINCNYSTNSSIHIRYKTLSYIVNIISPNGYLTMLILISPIFMLIRPW